MKKEKIQETQNDFQEDKGDEYSEDEESRSSLLLNKKTKKERKNENKILLQNKRTRENENTDIIHEENKKNIINIFCPNQEELNNSSEKCKINEINDKTYIEEKPDKSKPQIENKTELINSILDTEILDLRQKEELNKLISDIKIMKINDIIKKDCKLNIAFDLEKTCIYSFTSNYEKNKDFNTKFPHKKINLISFDYNGKTLFCYFIIRNGLYEFLEYAKLFCNFYINSLGIEPYVIQIILNLEQLLNVKFQNFRFRKTLKDTKKFKSLKDLGLNKKNSIIFDDMPSTWTNDYMNVIISKKFTDKELEGYSPRINNENDKMEFLMNYYPFYFYRIKKNDLKQKIWKNQKLYNGRSCPFYKFTSKNDIINNVCYSGQYLESSRYQFDYMKDVI